MWVKKKTWKSAPPFVTHCDSGAGLASFTGSISSLISLSWGFIHAAGTLSRHIDQTSDTQLPMLGDHRNKELLFLFFSSCFPPLPSDAQTKRDAGRKTELTSTSSCINTCFHADRVNTGILRAAPLIAITVQKCGKLKFTTDFDF